MKRRKRQAQSSSLEPCDFSIAAYQTAGERLQKHEPSEAGACETGVIARCGPHELNSICLLHLAHRLEQLQAPPIAVDIP